MLGFDRLAGVNEVLTLVLMLIDFQDLGTVAFPFGPLLPVGGDGPPLVVVPPERCVPGKAVRIPVPESSGL